MAPILCLSLSPHTPPALARPAPGWPERSVARTEGVELRSALPSACTDLLNRGTGCSCPELPGWCPTQTGHASPWLPARFLPSLAWLLQGSVGGSHYLGTKEEVHAA